jgi:3-deoxy-D-manno-octulosonate 8-phosphate phosphatase KdsC-like HAD superfamily phosphatase
MAKQWTDKEDACLIALQAAGVPHREVAVIMHRTKAAVSQRVFNLGITKKHKPTTKPKPEWWASMMWWRK